MNPGSRLYGAQRGTPRRARHASFVADLNRDTSPDYAPYFATPWTVAPTSKTAGAFGVGIGNRLHELNSDATIFLPTVGNRKLIKSSAGAYALLPSDSGAAVVFDQAAGITITLPPPSPGMWFEFFVGVTATSAAHKVITDAATTFLLGTFAQSTDSTYTEARRAANGTDIVAWSGNGSTTGGIVGDWFEVFYFSATQWFINGRGSATGAEASPFATS